MLAGTLRKNRRVAALVLLFLVALGVRTFRGWQEVIANPDVMRYVDQMKNLAHDPVGTMRAEVYHPLHALFGLLMHQAVGGWGDERMGWIWALRIVGIVAGSVLATQIARLARWFGAPFWASWAAGAVWIVGRRSSVYGSDGLSDMITWALFAESLLQAMPALRELQRTGRVRHGRWLLAGGLSGLSYLARPEGAAAVVMLGGTLAVLAVFRQRWKSRRGSSGRWFKILPRRRLKAGLAVSAAVWLGVGFLIVALPYMVTIGGFTGKKPLAMTASQAPLRQASLLSNSLHNVKKVTDELQETFFWAPWLAFLLAVPLKPRLWGRPRLRTLAVVWILVWDTVMYWLIGRAGYLDGRHTLPLILLLHVLLALALATWVRPMALWMAWWRARPAAWARLPAWRRWRGWPRVCALGVFVFAVTPGIILFGERPRYDKENLREAAAWIHTHARSDVVVCDYERLVGFYSGNPYAPWRGLQKGFENGSPRLDEIENARRDHGNVPALVGKVYLSGETLPSTIGPYQEIMRFQSLESGDLYVLYARAADPWQR